ncbi:hypothetical protein ACN6A1_17395 [Myxococcus virescens]
MLGQAGVLAQASLATRTSPVLELLVAVALSDSFRNRCPVPAAE